MSREKFSPCDGLTRGEPVKPDCLISQLMTCNVVSVKRLQGDARRRAPLASPAQEAVVGLMRTADVVRRGLTQVVDPHGITDVYDLTVDAAHNFVADCMIAHNSIEQDADVVCFIYREEIYNQSEENRGVAELIVSKQRNGPTGVVQMAFLKEFTRFENMWHE